MNTAHLKRDTGERGSPAEKKEAATAKTGMGWGWGWGGGWNGQFREIVPITPTSVRVICMDGQNQVGGRII